MLKKALSVLLLLSILSSACVRAKLYRAELAGRSAAEGREKSLQEELVVRKQALATLTGEMGRLNRRIGNLDAQLQKATAGLADCTQQMGKSEKTLASEKKALEKELAATKVELSQRIATIQQIRSDRQEGEQILLNLKDTLVAAFKGQVGIAIAVVGQTVTLNLPDKSLFETKGLEINALAKPILIALAKVLTNRPEMDAEVVSYTDSVLPKDKGLKDSWDWSLHRATNVVRILVQDYNVNANQLTPVGRGEFYPLAANDKAEGRQKNRRTLIVLHPALPGSR